MPEPFVHLHVHTEYSILKGVQGVQKWIAAAKDKNITALAFTEDGNMASAMAAYLAAAGSGVKCIFGLQIEIVGSLQTDAAGDKIVLIAANDVGYRNLLRISRYSWTRGYARKRQKPRLDLRALKAMSAGLFALTGSLTGPIARASAIEYKLALGTALDLQKIFGKRLIAEFQLHDTDDQRAYNQMLLKIADELGLRKVVTGDCRYPLVGQHLLAEALLQLMPHVSEAVKNTAIERSKYLMSVQDLEQLRARAHPYITPRMFADMVKTTNTIGNLCTVEIEIDKFKMPEFDRTTHELYRPEMQSNTDLFMAIAKDGFLRKVAHHPKKSKKLDEYKARFKFEADVIKRAGFVDYFLIVEDIIRWSKNNNIAVGAARGSVAGSLVAFCMDITEIDPIEFDLLFERFLNPARISKGAFPDVDLDFERIRRPDVKAYITKRYGADHVCTIATYATMQPKSLLRNLHRAFGGCVPENAEGKLVPVNVADINDICDEFRDEKIKTIAQAKEESDTFKKFYKAYPFFVDFYCAGLEGQVSTPSRHAAAVLITPVPVVDCVPVRTAVVEDEGRIVVSQWEDTYCERRGLLKLDVLGIKTLNVIKRCKELVLERHGLEIDLRDIDLNDKDVLAGFGRGETQGDFQYNSELMSGYLKEMQDPSFEDLITTNAILRPGPMGADAHRLLQKLRRGEIEAEYDHEMLKPYIGRTHGLYVYQEDIMRAANILGKLSLADADSLRQSMKKKDPKVMEPFRQAFVTGCQENGLTEEHANHVWEKFLVWSGYGFNRCLPANARIRMANGPAQRIETLYRRYHAGQQIEVMSYDPTSGQLVPHRVARVVKCRHQRIATFRTRTGGVRLRCTIRHGIFVKHIFTSGSIFDRKGGFRLAKDLMETDMMGCVLDNENTTSWHLIDVERSFYDETKKEQTYDIELDDEPHNYIADQVVVHNSHSCSYAHAGYHCEWLKHYFPIEFWTSTLEYASADEKKHETIWTFRKHIRELGFEIEPPDATRPDSRFGITDEGKITWALRALKGIGQETADAIAAACAEREPKTLAEFYDAIPKRKVNRKIFNIMIQADAFRRFGTRSQVATEYYLKLRKDKLVPPEYLVPETDVWHWEGLKDKVLGYLDVSMRDRLRDWFSPQVSTIPQILAAPEGKPLIAGGVVRSARIHKGFKGSMVFVQVYDTDGDFLVFIGPKYYKKNKPQIKAGDVIEVFGYRQTTKRGEAEVSLATDDCQLAIYRPEDKK